jgi:hypothetical protein
MVIDDLRLTIDDWRLLGWWLLMIRDCRLPIGACSVSAARAGEYAQAANQQSTINNQQFQPSPADKSRRPFFQKR